MKIEKLKNWREEIVDKLKRKNCTAIVKVNLENHIPKNFELRSKIDNFIFTANLTKESIDAIRNDDNIVSIQLNSNFNTLN